jgi:hypothetical protein
MIECRPIYIVSTTSIMDTKIQSVIPPQAEAKPLIDALERWRRGMLEKHPRKSDTSAAIMYALNLWPALARYCDDGMIEIDNSKAERALCGVAIGRRNYLFAGADTGGERAAAIYSLIATAKLNGVYPEAWLRHVLAHIADHPVNRVDEFQPWHYARNWYLPKNMPLASYVTISSGSPRWTQDRAAATFATMSASCEPARTMQTYRIHSSQSKAIGTPLNERNTSRTSVKSICRD